MWGYIEYFLFLYATIVGLVLCFFHVFFLSGILGVFMGSVLYESSLGVQFLGSYKVKHLNFDGFKEGWQNSDLILLEPKKIMAHTSSYKLGALISFYRLLPGDLLPTNHLLVLIWAALNFSLNNDYFYFFCIAQCILALIVYLPTYIIFLDLVKGDEI